MTSEVALIIAAVAGGILTILGNLAIGFLKAHSSGEQQREAASDAVHLREMDERSDWYKDLRETSAGLKEQVAVLKGQNAALSLENLKLRETVFSLTQQIATLTALNESLAARMTVAEGTIKKLEDTGGADER